MNTKIPLILIFFCLTGCQQKNEVAFKSEVDKCVDAIVKADVTVKDPLGILPDSKDAKPKAVIEAQARLDCLRAQAGQK
jgi:hypothetical protein